MIFYPLLADFLFFPYNKNMKEKKEIKILGAGISGLTCAINLAKAGRKVIVYEREKEIGKRYEGDFRGLENWSEEKDFLDFLKDINIKINFLCEPISAATLFGPSGKEYIFSLKRPAYYTVKRGKDKDCLDYGLAEQARSLGAEIILNVEKKQNEADIVATGSVTEKYLDALVRGMIFETNLGDYQYAVLNDKIAPNGYGYFLIHHHIATLAACIFKDYQRADYYLDETLKFFQSKIKFNIKNSRKFGGYGSFFIADTAIKNGKLYLGEAAGFQDFLWGFGMRYAMRSGFLAAKSILENKNYDQLWKKALLPQMKASVVNRFIFQNIQNTGYEKLLKKAHAKKDLSLLRQYYNFSPKHSALWPIAKMVFAKHLREK